MEQRCRGTMQVWAEPFTKLRMPKIFNLRMDPYERADQTSNAYWDWMIHNAFWIYGAQAAAAQFLSTFREFPPAQVPGSFDLDQAVQKMQEIPHGSS
jgi:arylsulfatase